MKPEDFEKKMEELKAPKSEANPPKELRLAIVSARRSAALGAWFVIVPWLFFIAMLLKHRFNVDFGLIDTVAEMMAALDRDPSTWWIGPVLILGLPVVAIVINTLAITHFKWESFTGSLIVSIRMKWINIAVLIVSFTIVGIFLLYLVAENCR
jgi:hypothetical protein